MHVFPTHFAYFIGVHSGMEYARVIRSKPNTCVHTYYYTLESIPCIGLEPVMLTVLHFQMSYIDTQMTMCILTL